MGIEDLVVNSSKPRPWEVCGGETVVVTGGGVNGIGDGGGDGM